MDLRPDSLQTKTVLQVANLDNGRPLAQLDLRVNPIGRGTRRCWRSTMAPNIRCEATTTFKL